MEDGRIYTYTHVKIEQGVAGELGTGAESWVRTMGGVVGKIGQMVDGEPIFTSGKSSLLFMRKFKASGTWEISARARASTPFSWTPRSGPARWSGRPPWASSFLPPRAPPPR